MLVAEFTKGGKNKLDRLDLALMGGGQRIYLESHEVMGKREARKVAESLGAKPWNF